ncbi:MAG: SAM-dependent methyltransferase [Rhodobacteraceae bacterium]|nr:SAM-dependent methyltransferase [Paracoccaceae bacterium]
MTNSTKNHWNSIYSTKKLNQVSWYQPIPQVSLDFIESLNFSKDAPILDVGGGDSFLCDNLIELGYSNITVLDISDVAIQRAKRRLGNNANKVSWIVSDILNFEPKEKYAIWHDRAVFHFLRENENINKYLNSLLEGLVENGRMILGAFAENGPTRCCALDVKRYSFEDFNNLFSDRFTIVKTQNSIHKTPFDTEQSFNFIEAKKK